jgi:hypothetical protein
MSLSENFKKAHLERKSGRSRLAASALLAAVAVSASGCGNYLSDNQHEAEKRDFESTPADPVQHHGGAGGGGGGGGGGTY